MHLSIFFTHTHTDFHRDVVPEKCRPHEKFVLLTHMIQGCACVTGSLRRFALVPRQGWEALCPALSCTLVPFRAALWFPLPLRSGSLYRGVTLRSGSLQYTNRSSNKPGYLFSFTYVARGKNHQDEHCQGSDSLRSRRRLP